MVQGNMLSKHNSKDTANASLAALGRTLEALEARLAKLTPTPVPASLPSGIVGNPAAAAVDRLSHAAALPYQAAERRRPSLADAVSEIVMRRQMLDDTPPMGFGALHQPASGSAAPAIAPTPVEPHPLAPRSSFPREEAFAPREDRPSREERLEKRFQALASDVEALRAEGSNYTLMAEVAEELQQLRHELRQDGARSDPRFEAMREAFDALRRMIETRQSAETIGAEMSDISERLARLTEEGADRFTLNKLRAELEEMRNLFGDLVKNMAKEKTVAAVGQRWDAFEDRLTQQAESDTQSRTDLKNELERLRESLRSLASEDHVRAVEKRWDDFEDRYLGQSAAPSDDKISKLLRDELETMREKLEGMAQESPMQAVEARWGALEERLDSREVEASIHRLAERMGEIEETLASLPVILGIAPLEERMRALALSVETLANRETETDLDHFIILEERLDEISRAIVAASRQVPAFDMGPIERIEARIAALTARVDRFADEADAEAVSLRIADLSDRVEDIANGGLTEELNRRVAGLAERLEIVFAEIERPAIDTAAIEERLVALTLRLEEAVAPRVDTELMRSLEAQIAQLSQSLAHVGTLSADGFDQDFDRRLALVEQRLDENRDALIAAARQAAEETALRMEAAGERRQGEHVAQLSENLRSLEQLSRETDDRSTQVFDAVHATLLKIVDRLEMIEVEIARGGERVPATPRADMSSSRAAAHMAAASVMESFGAGGGSASARNHGDAPHRGAAHDPAADEELARVQPPSLDASTLIGDREVNRPLEPGSGAPDIGALLERVRLQQRGKTEATVGEPLAEAETRAAARRAVKAAVAEAEMLRAPSAAGADSDRKFSFGELVSRRRKTILMGVTAVLVALAALPVSQILMSDGSGETAAQVAPETDAPAPAAADIATFAAPAAMAEPVEPADGGVRPSPETTEGTDKAENGPAIGSTPVAPPQADEIAVRPEGSAETPSASTAPTMPVSENSSSTETSVLMASASAKLPPSASGDLPAIPAAIGSPALIGAANAADPKALFEIGLRLLEGRGSEPKPAEALDWFAQSARRGFAPAQYSLGTLFEKGNGVTRDTGAARDWYLLAALQGNVRAMHNLAVLYATGIEGKSAPETAAEWFEKAAGYGMRDSQYNLGILYARGSGVEQNLASSYKWFAIVGKSGDKDAEAKRDEVGKSLAPDQLAAAEADVARWQAADRNEAANTVDVPPEWSDPKSDQTASVDMKRAVRNIQAILGKLGYDAGTPDGVAGGKTKTAIASFQKDAGLNATGEIDETLIRALLKRKES